MSKKYKVRFLIMLSVFLFQFGYSQKIFYLGIGDSLYNRIPAHRGTVQWQYSYDNGINWDNYQEPDFNNDTFGIKIQADVKIRAKVTEGNCEIFSDITTVYTTVSDYDGNVYPIKKIGTQIWMTENLKTTHYYDGQPIVYLDNAMQWSSNATGSYCAYDNDIDSAKSTFGYLYSWTNTQTMKLCPNGWYVPSDTEWNVLIDYLNKNQLGYNGSSDSIAKSIASKGYWLNSTILGSVGNDAMSNNSTGFNGKPCGYRSSVDGSYVGKRDKALWWSSTSVNYLNYPRSFGLSANNPYIIEYTENEFPKFTGMSIRCVKIP